MGERSRSAPAARVAVPTTRALVDLVAGGAIGVVLAARSVRIGDRGVDALVPSVAVWSVVGCVLCLLLAALRARRFDSAR
ncbi:hypothetical protein MBEHAL_1964 [Halarchaeum acidiphilum MH1-52-1]|uniref:Uncharacterized protein n=1 Tax=Halarchaeum acidiphilum MH1-52-1 TaxID=1261545 RepID=U3A6B2_9EURY|nr:hypothetical protein MBEHAL_1964 [Halarchaeum acidiphilum MH1-52-1]